MQNKVYSRYIYQMLMEYGRVAIPDLGTFYLRHNTAYFSDNKQSLFPPTTGIYFSPSVRAEFHFAELLHESGLNAAEAQLLESLVVNDYRDSDKENVAFTLDNLGEVKENQFTEHNAETFNKFTGLLPVGASVVGKQNIIHDENFEYYLNRKNTADSGKISDYIWPILVALITILCIVLWSLPDEKGKEQDVIIKNNAPDAYVMPENEDSLYDEIDKTLEDSKLIADPKKDTISEPEYPAESTEKQGGNPVIEKGQLECVVIVGAFADSSNAARMVKRIKSKGYKPFKQDKDGKTRVGVMYNCSIHDPDDYRSKMKKIFNPDAWHLHDTLH